MKTRTTSKNQILCNIPARGTARTSNFRILRKFSAPFDGQFGSGETMSELNTVVNATLLADDNQASVSAMLNAILEKPLTPMEANQAKTYMEQVASQAANDEGAEVQLFQLMEMTNQHTTYVMRVALFSNNKAIGLDVMDAENGQFFVPESCPVVELQATTLN